MRRPPHTNNTKTRLQTRRSAAPPRASGKTDRRESFGGNCRCRSRYRVDECGGMIRNCGPGGPGERPRRRGRRACEFTHGGALGHTRRTDARRHMDNITIVLSNSSFVMLLPSTAEKSGLATGTPRAPWPCSQQLLLSRSEGHLTADTPDATDGTSSHDIRITLCMIVPTRFRRTLAGHGPRITHRTHRLRAGCGVADFCGRGHLSQSQPMPR